jgi:hypothetical protein
MARLREVYPNMMELRFAQPADLFRAFYRDMVDTEISDAGLESPLILRRLQPFKRMEP